MIIVVLNDDLYEQNNLKVWKKEEVYSFALNGLYPFSWALQ